MMHLPTFTDPNPLVEWLRKEQDRLHRQADKMLASTGVLADLSKHGTVCDIRGSYGYGLMIYPDLDLSVLANDFSKEAFAEMARDMLTRDYVRKISTFDGVRFVSSKSPDAVPKGYWLGLEIPYEQEKWGMDCWFVSRDEPGNSADGYADKLKTLDRSQKDAVLSIKYHLIREGNYGGKRFSSSDVYDAVLEKDISSIDEFYKRMPGKH